jgi:predicted RNase H-like HicB family nuclease/DNA-binding XRE family transcriptional regulator
MKYSFRIHKEGMGYWAQGIELPGCFTQGNSLEDLHKNMKEALNLMVSEPADSDDFVPLPDKSVKASRSIVKVPVDPQVAFSFYVRLLRKKHKLTQKQMASKLGFKSIFQYQRLEAAHHNPTLNTLTLVKSLFPEISLDQLCDVTEEQKKAA